MEDWKEYKLEDVCNISSSKRIFAEEYTTNGIPFYRGKEIIEKHNNSNVSSELFITEKRFNEIKSKFPVPRKNDILLTSVGTLGVPWLVDEENFYFKDGNLTWLRSNSEQLNPCFLYYWLESSFAKNQIDAKCIGSTQKALIIDTLSKFDISLPPLPTQQKIAALLSSLDDKIELNNKINANLEQQAQALFKNWFVDFEPFGGEMPDGWKMGKLSDVLKLKKNVIQPGEDTSLPYLPIDLIPIKSLALTEVRPNEEALSSLLKFEENDILIGAMRVYFHRVAIAPFDGITRTTCFVLEPFNKAYFAYAAITCNQDLAIDYAQKTSKGSTMPYAVWEGGLGEFEIPIPDENTATQFNDMVKPLIEQIKNSYFENKKLSSIRDTLLPKLMSGELEVN